MLPPSLALVFLIPALGSLSTRLASTAKRKKVWKVLSQPLRANGASPCAESEPIDEDLGLTIIPNVITAKTRRVGIDGILQHFLNNHACDVSITGTFGLRPAG